MPAGAPPTFDRARLAFWALVGASFLYGSTFVVVKEAIRTLPPLAFVGWRFLIGAAALLLIRRPIGSRIWRDGFVAGVFLFIGYTLQTEGLLTTGAANSALITGLYVVVTPLAASGIRRSRPAAPVLLGSMAAFAGLALLMVEEGMRFRLGDLLTVGAAVGFALHIAAVGHLAHRHPVVPFTGIQLGVTALLALIGSALFEAMPLPGAGSLPALLGTGLGVSAGAYLLQIWAQTAIGPARTAIILALEPGFGAATAALVLGERLTTAGLLGAGLILAAIFLVLTRAGGGDEIEAESVSASP